VAEHEVEGPAPSEQVRLVALRDEPLKSDEVLAALGDDAGGGITLFVGRVRDHDQGKGVVGLDYSAHPSALDVMTDVCRTVAARHDVVAVAAVHRTGRLGIGDAAVILGAVAHHRGESFTAAEDLIDTLKREVPIWKHQVFTDGTDEWVGSP
jgi:molybdopterin synthase catalytic subunit